MNLPPYADVRAVAQANIIPHLPLSDSTDEGMGQATARTWLKGYLDLLSGGCAQTRLMGHTHVERKLREIDPLLRLRWDFEHESGGMYVIDRYAPDMGCYITLFWWSHTLGEGGAIRAILLASDMQRADTPKAYHQLKQSLVDAALKRKDKERAEAALAAVDQLSNARIRNFLAVERAMQIGEKVHVRGEDARWLNKSYELTKAGMIPDVGGAINPGMHPFRHRRMSRPGGYNISTGNLNG